MRFYERALDGKLEGMRTHAEGPPGDDLPPGNSERIMHARLAFDGGVLLASDALVGEPSEPMKGFALSLIYPTVDGARRVFDALAEGGQVTLPLQKVFWSEAFGMLTDRFGTPWMINGGMAEA
jgi:PhnB protein